MLHVQVYQLYSHILLSVELAFRCGLVALAMADSVLNNGVNIEKITEASRRKGISKQGEMFSCKLIIIHLYDTSYALVSCNQGPPPTSRAGQGGAGQGRG